jgi:hypothetical protein
MKEKVTINAILIIQLLYYNTCQQQPPITRKHLKFKIIIKLITNFYLFTLSLKIPKTNNNNNNNNNE